VGPESAERSAAGVVVGVHRVATADPPVRWAADEARRRHLPLTLVHAWREHLDIEVTLSADALPDLDGPVEARAAHGRAAAVLLGYPADLLVLGAHSGTLHLRHVTRLCLHQATCPVVVVPEADRPPVGRIVVGVDGADTSREALLWAAEAAALRGVTLTVVQAWQVRPHSPTDVLHPRSAVPTQQAAAQGRLRSWAESVVADTSAIDFYTPHGAPLDMLLDCAADADLVVIGRRSHSGLRRVLHGAAGDSLSALAPCPVAVVPTTARHAKRPV